MALPDEEEFISEYQHEGSSDFPRDAVKSAQNAARTKIENLVGTSVVTDTINADQNSYSAKDLAIRDAFNLLTFRRLLLTIRKFRDGGMPERQSDGSDAGSNSFESFDKVNKRREALLEAAMEVLSPYLETEEITKRNKRVRGSSFVPVSYGW